MVPTHSRSASHLQPSPKDDLLGAASDILVAMEWWMLGQKPCVGWSSTRSTSFRRDVRTIIAMGGTGAGKTQFSTFWPASPAIPEGTVGTQRDGHGRPLRPGQTHFYPELIDDLLAGDK